MYACMYVCAWRKGGGGGGEGTIKVWSGVILAWHRFFQMGGHDQIFETYCSET